MLRRHVLYEYHAVAVVVAPLRVVIFRSAVTGFYDDIRIEVRTNVAQGVAGAYEVRLPEDVHGTP